MAVYVFKAGSLGGETWKGTIEADSVEALEYLLNDKGYFPLSIKEKSEAVSLMGLIDKVNKRDLAVFCRQLSVIINSGMTIVDAIDILSRQVSKKSFRNTLELVSEDVQKGKLLSQALSDFPAVFPEFFRNMIKVGEATGTLDTITERLADYYEKEDRLNRKVKSAMIYPIILSLMTVGVIVLLIAMVLPVFSNVLSEMGGELPGITLALMSISNYTSGKSVCIIIALFPLMVGITAYSRTTAGRLKMDTLKLKIPILRNITIKIITSRFARSMGILLRSGINIISAMHIMSSLIGNRAIEMRFVQSSEDVRQGRGIAFSLNKLGIFPPLLIHMVAVGERTGNLDQMLLRTSGFFDDEVEASISKMSTIIEPLVIVILAVVVAIILFSIFLPMLTILDSVA